MIRLMGIDPGLAHLGVAVCEFAPIGIRVIREVNSSDDAEPTPVMYCLETEKSDKKLAVKASDDNTRRARELFVQLEAIVREHEVKAICTEAMSFPRSSSAAHKMGISWGVIVALSCLFDLPIVQASPKQVKQSVCGRADASKEDVQRALSAAYDVPLELFTKTRREHPFDALGAVVSCQDSEVVRTARKMSEVSEDFNAYRQYANGRDGRRKV